MSSDSDDDLPIAELIKKRKIGPWNFIASSPDSFVENFKTKIYFWYNICL